MSINILKRQVEYSSISTNIYVRTLRSYSIVQFVTYGPLIIFMLLSTYDSGIFTTLNEFVDVFVQLDILKAIASLSGFFNTLIFLVQGTGNLKKSQPDLDQDTLGTDLTLDTA